MPKSPETDTGSDTPPSSRNPLPRMNALRVFESAARHLSFSAAAAELRTTQPSVSRAIAELECQLGTRLFERGHRAILLTPAGEVFHRTVVICLERIATGALTAAGLADDRRIVIACGGPPRNCS